MNSLSRRQLIGVAASSLGGAAVLAACGEDRARGEGETARFGEGDIGILNYALTISYLEASLYGDAVESGLFEGPDLETLRRFGDEEDEHVAGLVKAVERAGGEPAAKPPTGFPLGARKEVLALMAKIEGLATAAFLGQVPNLESASAQALLLSILSVESRHKAALDGLLRRPPIDGEAFAASAAVETVLGSLKPFMVGSDAA